jgi:hypothetical protein
VYHNSDLITKWVYIKHLKGELNTKWVIRLERVCTVIIIGVFPVKWVFRTECVCHLHGTILLFIISEKVNRNNLWVVGFHMWQAFPNHSWQPVPCSCFLYKAVFCGRALNFIWIDEWK